MELNEKYDHYDFPWKAENAPEGHAGNLTEAQLKALDALRARLEMEAVKKNETEAYSKRLDTLTLLRFLRARKFNVEASLNMFVACEDWRKQIGLDKEVLDHKYPEGEQIKQYYIQYYHKTDQIGRPVYVEKLGGIDLTAMKKITSMDNMLLHLAVEYERMADIRLPACSRKANSLIETSCTIMDIKDVGVSSFWQVYEYVKSVSNMSQNYYPERLGKLYLINTPYAIKFIWGYVEKYLDEVTRKKIEILTTQDYVRSLKRGIDEESLPKEFGGKCTCSGEGGCGNSDAGPWKDEAAAKRDNEAEKTTVENPGSAIETPAVTTGVETASAPVTSEPKEEAKQAVAA